ncbi:CLOCK-interacting pacemaker-like isoform X1 [Mauremys reevesii]|uniref:CLOCK-interacting pacemaker-like isoform X1 n=2 Tax=Mauremys reevesii TaxID=260615 RepID=UPI00193F07FC|nr:CLOCK-interacting pacemaker-like isoform X1 [Mauremys reevesii]
MEFSIWSLARKMGLEMPAEKPPATERPCQPLVERGMAVGGTAAATVSSKGRTGLLEKPAMGGEGSRKSPGPHPPASESEKDSGFSDTSSESLSTLDQAEAEEPSICASHWATNGPRLRTAQDLDSTFTRFTPVYIVKNVILKQPPGASSSTQLLPWSGQAPPDSVQGQARLIFLQQPMATATLKPLLPGRKPQAKDTYLPILNAYPRIAPHPGHSQENEASAGPLPPSGSAGHAKSKRFCLEEAWVSSSELDAPTSCGLREEQCQGGALQVPSAGSSEPLSQNTVTSSTELARPAPSSIAAQGSPALLDLAEGRILAKASKKLGSSLGKQRRFHNTVEILRKSGLLGVTLRTKELIRQNSSTQREIAELREHARLLCEAMQSNNSQTWARLQAAMSLSASYWAQRGTGPNMPAKAKAATPHRDCSGESLPGSPMSLALTPDLSAHTALP